MKKLKSILVDAKNKEVREVEIDQTKVLDNLYSLIGCSCVTLVNLSKREDLYVDDEGLLNGSIDYGFRYEGFPQILAGNGVVLGITSSGNSASTKMTVEEVKQKVTFHEVTQKSRDRAMDDFCVFFPG